MRAAVPSQLNETLDLVSGIEFGPNQKIHQSGKQCFTGVP
jgi:hypothetical protein